MTNENAESFYELYFFCSSLTQMPMLNAHVTSDDDDETAVVDEVVAGAGDDDCDVTTRSPAKAHLRDVITLRAWTDAPTSQSNGSHCSMHLVTLAAGHSARAASGPDEKVHSTCIFHMCIPHVHYIMQRYTLSLLQGWDSA